MSLKIREIVEQILRGMNENYDTSLIEYLLDNKPILRRTACYRLQREESGCNYFWTILHAAARYGRSDMLKLFDKGGCMMESMDERKRTPLWYAAAYSQSATLFQLLEGGSKTRYPDIDGWTPLHAAARYGHIKTCEILLDHGSNVDAQDYSGFTPLHKAIWGDHIATAEYFVLTARARVNIASREGGITPLHLALQRCNHQLVDLIIRVASTSTNSASSSTSSFTLASSDRSFVGRQNDIYGIIPPSRSSSFLTTSTLTGNSSTMSTLTPMSAFGKSLGLPLTTGRDEVTETVKQLVNQRTKTGLTPLMLACREGDMSLINKILACDANVNVSTSNGWTALHMVVENGNPSPISILVERGADINAVNKDGWTPFHLAAKLGKMDTMRTLRDLNADCQTLTTLQGYSAVHLAAQQGNAYAVRYLIEEVGLPPAQRTLQSGQTALHIACARGHSLCAQTLVQAGCPIGDEDANGNSPLHLSASQGQLHVIKLLLVNGANILHAGPVFKRFSKGYF